MPQSKPWLPSLDDRPGPAPSISDARAKAMVDAALDGAFAPRARGRVRRLTRMTFALAATLVAFAAAAGTLSWRRSRLPPRPAAPAPTSVALPAGPAPTPGPVEDAPVPTPTETPAPRVIASAPSHGTGAPPGELSDLLAHANDLRAARRWRDAMLMYERVASTRPSSAEAYAARVAAADLRLEQLGDPAGALRLYRAARTAKGGDGRLDEQVRWGIARSTRALGDARAEGNALEDYLSRYPDGLFAPDARQRLSVLVPAP
jgi:hypothetical protein